MASIDKKDQLTPDVRYKINPTKRLEGEIRPFSYEPSHNFFNDAVVAYTTNNPSYNHFVNLQRKPTKDDIAKVNFNVPATYYLKLKSNPPIEIYNFELQGNYTPTMELLPQNSSFEERVNALSKMATPPFKFIYDLLTSYQTSYEGEPDRKRSLTEYFRLLKQKVAHGGVLLVQLLETKQGNTDEQNLAIAQYNKEVSEAII